MKNISLICCLTVASTLIGCGTANLRDLPAEYSETVSALGIRPVYPPRSEFQVGDIYFWSYSPDRPFETEAVWIGSAPWALAAAEQHMRTRVAFESTELGNDGKATPHTQPDLFTANALRLRQDIDGNEALQLPQVGFPEINADAGFVSQTFLTGLTETFGLGLADRTTVSLNFPDVRSYWVPKVSVHSRAVNTIQNTFAGSIDAAYTELTSELTQAGFRQTDPCSYPNNCGLTMITRVYLTRRILFTFSNSRIAQAALSVAGAANPDGSVVTSRAPQVTFQNVTVESGSNDEFAARFAELASLLPTGTSPSALGAQSSFVGWNARGISFEQTFPSAVAIGWEGVSLDLIEQGVGPVRGPLQQVHGSASQNRSEVIVLDIQGETQ